MSLVSRQVLVLYDVGGPDLWHERLVLDHIIADDYMVVSPDGEIFYEELGLHNSDLRGIRIKPSATVLPPGVDPARVYPLPNFSALQIANFRAESQRQLVVERANRGLAPNQRGDAVVAGASGAAFEKGVLYWVAAEQVGDVKFGDKVGAVPDPLVKGGKAIHHLPSGGSVFVECIDGEDRHAFLQRPALIDPRVVPSENDVLGKPECSLKDAAKKCVEKEVGWSLTGPRTCRWCLSYLAVEGLGLEGHHERFRTLCKIDSSSWGVQEHYQLSMIAKHLVQIDQYNVYNSMGCEVIFRRLRTIEFAYAERAREAESKAIGGKLSLEEQQTFGGVTRQSSTLMICPGAT